MNIIPVKLEELEKPIILELGFAGENMCTGFSFACDSVFSEYPDAIPSMAVTPPKGSKYPVVVTRDGNNVLWNITDSDTAYMGSGEVQLIFTQNNVVKRSYTCRTRILKSILAEGTPPDPVQSWIDSANEMLAEIPETIDAAIDTAIAAAKASGEFKGDPGFSPVVTTAPITGGNSVKITDEQGEHSFNVLNGANGVSPDLSVTPFTGGHRITIVDASGTNTFDVTNGVDATPDLITVDYANLTFPVAKGATCYHNGQMFEAKVAIQTAEEWDSTKWDPITVEEQIGSVLNDIQGLTDDVNELTTETDFIHNALGKTGQFDPSTSWYKIWGTSTYSVSDGVASILCSNQYGGIRTLAEFTIPANHKIYAFAKLKGLGARLTFTSTKHADSISADEFNFVSLIESWTVQVTNNLYIVDTSASDFQTIYAKEIGMIDLTETFGDVVPTKAQLDAFVTQVGFFENFPVGTFLRKFYTDYIKAGANGYPNLGNKTIVIMGDSITMQNQIDGNGNMTKVNTNWPDYAMPLLGDPTVYNFAQDGSTYHDVSGSLTYQTFTKQYNLMVSKGINPDIIILAFGTNDYQYTHTDDYATAMNIYSLNGLDKTNNYQSIRWAYWTLTENYPNALIIVSTPIQRADVGVSSTNWIREAITQMARPYCMNVVDAMLESGIMGQYEKAPGYGAGRYLADGLHPNTAGKKLLGRYWAYKIAQLFSPDKFDKSDVS